MPSPHVVGPVRVKRTPLRRKTPLRAKKGLSRGKGLSPRSADRAPVPPEKRVDHKRSKPKESDPPSPEQKRFWRWLRFVKGCVITGVRGERFPPSLSCTIHHVTSDGHKRLARDHWRVVPLRADHHQAVWDGKDSVEAMGHAKFNAKHEVDLLALSGELRAEWEAAGKP